MKKQSFIFDFDTFYVNTIYFLYINDGRSINHCCELASFDRCVEKEGDFIRSKKLKGVWSCPTINVIERDHCEPKSFLRILRSVQLPRGDSTRFKETFPKTHDAREAGIKDGGEGTAKFTVENKGNGSSRTMWRVRGYLLRIKIRVNERAPHGCHTFRASPPPSPMYTARFNYLLRVKVPEKSVHRARAEKILGRPEGASRSLETRQSSGLIIYRHVDYLVTYTHGTREMFCRSVELSSSDTGEKIRKFDRSRILPYKETVRWRAA